MLGSAVGSMVLLDRITSYSSNDFCMQSDGVHFHEHPSNPIVPYTASTPHTQAMAEGHVWFDEPRNLIHVFHTLR